MNQDNRVINELLFFIQNKINTTAKDEIVKTCVEFFSLDEVVEGSDVLQDTADIRLPTRYKTEGTKAKIITDIYEKLVSLDASAVSVPNFLAGDLTRIPQERNDSDSLASNEQILASIHGLRLIIKQLQSKMVTHEQLQTALSSHRPSTTTVSLVESTSASATATSAATSETLPPLVPLTMPFSSSAPPLSQEHFPTMEASTSSLSPDTAGNAPSLEASSSTHSSTMAANLANNLQNADFSLVVQRQREKIRPTKAAREPTKRGSSQRPIIIGKKVNDGICSWRGADLTVSRYVGRVAVGTSADAIRASLTSKGVDVVSIESLEMKHNRFVSFKLTVKKSQLSLVEDADIWPEGVMIGRWWSPKAAAPISATVSTIATA